MIQIETIRTLRKEIEKQGVLYTLNEPLCNHTSFKIGGPAAFFCKPDGLEQLAALIRVLQKNKVPFYILGKGTNVLFRDEGYAGAIIKIGRDFSGVRRDGNRMIAQAGAKMSDVCKAAQKAGLAGLEFAYGIPGSVGGAVYMNAGAYGGETKDVLESVTFLDENQNVRTLSAKDLQLGYRTSAFQANSWQIIEAAYRLEPGIKSEIADKMKKNMERRNEKQPLEHPSAGSAFKRPKGAYAGALIDECGLRGHQVGGAAISGKHCGFIVNLGGATCQDVLDLADHVVKVVQEQTGFVLEKEIRVIEAEL